MTNTHNELFNSADYDANDMNTLFTNYVVTLLMIALFMVKLSIMMSRLLSRYLNQVKAVDMTGCDKIILAMASHYYHVIFLHYLLELLYIVKYPIAFMYQ